MISFGFTLNPVMKNIYTPVIFHKENVLKILTLCSGRHMDTTQGVDIFRQTHGHNTRRRYLQADTWTHHKA